MKSREKLKKSEEILTRIAFRLFDGCAHVYLREIEALPKEAFRNAQEGLIRRSHHPVQALGPISFEFPRGASDRRIREFVASRSLILDVLETQPSGLEFSLSHTDSVVALLATRSAPGAPKGGVDIELKQRIFKKGVENRAFTSHERDLGVPLIHTWAAKEAAYKAASHSMPVNSVITDIELQTWPSSQEWGKAFSHKSQTSITFAVYEDDEWVFALARCNGVA